MPAGPGGSHLQARSSESGLGDAIATGVGDATAVGGRVAVRVAAGSGVVGVGAENDADAGVEFAPAAHPQIRTAPRKTADSARIWSPLRMCGDASLLAVILAAVCPRDRCKAPLAAVRWTGCQRARVALRLQAVVGRSSFSGTAAMSALHDARPIGRDGRHRDAAVPRIRAACAELGTLTMMVIVAYVAPIWPEGI
jgi:hypothetical protein